MRPRTVSMGTRMNQQQSVNRRRRPATKFSEGAQGHLTVTGINNQAGAFENWNAHIRYFLARYPLESRQFVAQRLATYGIRCLLSSYRQEDLILDVLASATDSADREVLAMMKQHARRRREMQQNAGRAPAPAAPYSFPPPALHENGTGDIHQRSGLAAAAITQASAPAAGVANDVLREREATDNVEAAGGTRAPGAKRDAAKHKPMVTARADVLARYPFVDDLTGVEGGGVHGALHRATPDTPLQNLARREIRRLAHGVFRELRASAHGIPLSDLPSALRALFFGDSASLLTANGGHGAAPGLQQRKSPGYATPDIHLITALAQEALPPNLAFAARDTSTLSSASTHAEAAGSATWSQQTPFIDESRWIKLVAHVIRRLWEMDGTIAKRYARRGLSSKPRVVPGPNLSPATGQPHAASLLERPTWQTVGNAISNSVVTSSPGACRNLAGATRHVTGDAKCHGHGHENGVLRLSRDFTSARDRLAGEVCGAVEVEPGWTAAADVAGGISSSSATGNNDSITLNGTEVRSPDDQDDVLIDVDDLAAPTCSINPGDATPEHEAKLIEAWEHAGGGEKASVGAWVGAGRPDAWAIGDMEISGATSTVRGSEAVRGEGRRGARQQSPVSSDLPVAADASRRGLGSGAKGPVADVTAPHRRRTGDLDPVKGVSVSKEGTRPAGMWEVTLPSHVVAMRRSGKQKSTAYAVGGQARGRGIPAYLRGVHSKIGAQVEEHRQRARRDRGMGIVRPQIAKERNAAVRDAVARRRLDELEGRTASQSYSNGEGEVSEAQASERSGTKRSSSRGNSAGEHALDIAEAFLESSLMTRLAGGDWFDSEDEESVPKEISPLWEPGEAVKTRPRCPVPAGSTDRWERTERIADERKTAAGDARGGAEAEGRRAYAGWLGDYGPPHTHTVRESGFPTDGSDEESKEGPKRSSIQDKRHEGLNPFEMSGTGGAKGQHDDDDDDRGNFEDEAKDSAVELKDSSVKDNRGNILRRQDGRETALIIQAEDGAAERKDDSVDENRGNILHRQGDRENSSRIPARMTEARNDVPDKSISEAPGSSVLSDGARSLASATPLPEAATALGSSIITTVSGRRSTSSGASGRAGQDLAVSPSERTNVGADEIAEDETPFGKIARGSSPGVEVDDVVASIDTDFEAYLRLAADIVNDGAGSEEGSCVTGEGGTASGGSKAEVMPVPVTGAGSDESAGSYTGPTTGSWWGDDTSAVMEPSDVKDD